MDKLAVKIIVGIVVLIVIIIAIKLLSKKKQTTIISTDVKNLDRVSQLLKSKYMTQNQKIIDGLNPTAGVKELFVDFINEVEKMGYAVILTSGYRDTAKQVSLKKENPKNATPGFSAHEYGLAIDLNLSKNGKLIRKDSPLKEWTDTGVIDLAKRMGLRWGGTFVGYLDPVHFDLQLKYDTKKLYAMALKKFGSVEKIRGNEIDLKQYV